MHSRILIVGLLPLLLLPQVGRADRIRLLSGGELRGELIEDPATAPESDTIQIATVWGSTVSVAREEIDFVERRSLLIEEYVTRSRDVDGTIESHWELANWCREHLLRAQRAEQLELILELDPEHAEARRILGYTKQNGRWMTRDQLMASRGYVKHKGKYITRQELDLLEKTQAERDAEIAWYPKVRLWFAWLTGRDNRRRAEALEQFKTLSDPDAVPAMATVMEDHESESVRHLFVTVLGQLPGPKPVGPLVSRLLHDSSEKVREAAFHGIGGDQYEAALPALVKALDDDQNPVIRRAAVALGIIGDERVIPPLIGALVTSHRYKVAVPSGNAISFGTTSSGAVGTVSPGQVTLPPQVEAAARTGQLPYGAVVVPHPLTPNLKRQATVKVDIKNAEVLVALQRLTGENYGYNVRDWELWWSLKSG